ncbi:polysaccharide biosynthesis tyrosine autokinase [Cupriavidus respiraculi]|uniref:non-specific protein-tyrosine kinase n=2 Tax=Cupriavidus respiraculi TaxID=195930 RepID=A0ABN7Y820_9BURK|nr:Tyrosine-protein kinase etk [Cupriavidus respiraculi]
MDRMSFAGAMPVPGAVSERRAGYGRALLDRVGWLMVATAAGAAIGGVLALSRAPQYEAAALIQVAGNDGALRDVATTGQSVPFDAGILRSRAVAGPVIERLRLGISAEPLRAPLVGTLAARLAEPGQARGAWPHDLGYAWGGERIAVDRLAVPERLLEVPMTLQVMRGGAYRLVAGSETLLDGQVGEPAAGAGVEMLVSRIDALPGTHFVVTRHDPVATIDTITGELKVDAVAGGAGTVRLAWRNGDRKVAADLVNGIADAYIRGQTSQRRDDAAGSLAFLTAELPRVKAELERAEAALTRYRSRSGSMHPTQDAQSYLQGSMDYQRQIAALRLERTKLLQRFTTDANEVKTVDSQIQQLTRERQDLDARMHNLSLSERESVAITRDVKVAEDMYMSLRNRIEQLSLVHSDRSTQTRVVDAAAAFAKPVGVGPWPATVGGGLVGLALAIGCVMLRRRLKPSVADASDAEARLGLSILGDIAHSDEQAELEREAELNRRFGAMSAFVPQQGRRLAAPQPGTALAEANESELAQGDARVTAGLHDRYLLARRSPHALAVEGLRSVRAALHFDLRAAPDGVVAITSPAPDSGKTFTAVNLAVLFAEAGQRVLLIDADMRRGRVAGCFDQPAEPGLADVLSGRVPLPAAVQHTVVAGLSILTAGRTPANPSELLMLPTLGDTLRACKQRFDLVIVDTPPVLSVADAMLVASQAGSTLLVMRADVTVPGQVDETLKRLTRANARLAGGIINGVAQRRSNRADFRTINPYLGMPLPAASPAVRALERPIGAAHSKLSS